MKKKKRGYGILLGFTVLFTILALITVIPNPNASKVSLLGFKSICSFAPIATIILLLLAGIVCVIRKRVFTDVYGVNKID